MSDVKNIVKSVRYDLGLLLKYMDQISDKLKAMEKKFNEISFNLDCLDRYLDAQSDFLSFPEVGDDEI